jgi:hypothetical protein
MPKAKPKVPKTEKMWMAWDTDDGGFFTHRASETKDGCESKISESSMSDSLQAVRVRIVPEAEYQRLIAATKRKEKET